MATESEFVYNAGSQSLTAILDVDESSAYFLSNAFAPITDAVDSSFSVEFRVDALDDQFTPTAFIGLLTTNHVGDFGHGLTLLLSTRDSKIIAQAHIEEDFTYSGSAIPIDVNRTYLAVGRYKAISRQFAVEIFDGNGFTNLVGFSTTSLPSGRSLRVDRIGLQNNGARKDIDPNVGSITLTVDNLFTPGSNPNSISISNASVTEGNSGTPEAVFTLTLSPASSQAVTVDYRTADGTAKAAVDYVATSGKLTFPPGIATGTLSVPIVVDLLDEDDETFFVRLSNPVDSALARTEATGTILDEDPLPTLTINDATTVEGDAGGGNQVVFTVTLPSPSGRTVFVGYSTVIGTARSPEDFVAKSGTVVFPPGVLSTNIAVSILGDLACEGNETFGLALSGLANATLNQRQGTGTIVDDDCGRLISISDASVLEGNAGTTQAVFTVTLNRAHSLPVSVDFFAVNGMAKVGTDLLARSGTLVFPPGVVETNIAVTVLGDRLPEEDETFYVNLSNPVNSGLPLPPRGAGTIVNDDPFPRLSVSDAEVVEGNSGTTNMVFTVQLSFAAIETVTVNYATSEGTAQAGVDFVSTSGTLTFPPGTTNQVIAVSVRSDVLDESDETLFVQLSSSASALIEKGQGLGTILDGDQGPCISINDIAVLEPDLGTVDAVFTVSLSTPSGQQVRVSYNTADHSAKAGSDYTATFGTLIFQPGTTQQTLRVRLLEDAIFEAEERFVVLLSSPANGTLCAEQGVGTITNTDEMPSISINSVSVSERPGGTNAVFTVRLSNPTSDAVTVDFSTTEGTAQSRVDYLPSSGPLTFPPGTVAQTVSIRVLDDLLNEDDETFFLDLSNPSHATIATVRGIGAIRDDDTSQLSVAETSLEEGDEGQRNAAFTVTLSPPSTRTISVRYATANGTATADEDYIAASGTLTFPPGNTSATVTVSILGDTKLESNETFFLNLTNPANAGFARASAVGTIIDDDRREISIDDVTVVEGNTGTTTNAVFALTLSKSSLNPIAVNYVTANGTATAGSDYRATNGIVTFAPGETRKNITVVVLGDNESEWDEDFLVNLSNPVNGSVKRPQGRGLIIDDDPRFRILPAGTSISAENCRPPNDAIDSYETVTVSFALVNRGNIPTPSFTATLLSTNGVTVSGAPTQNFGVLPPNGLAVSRPFTFSAAGICGQSVAVVLQLRDGIKDLGTASFDLTLGVNASGALVCCSQADVEVTVSDQPDPVFVGESLVYQVSVLNRGPAEAQGVALTPRLAAGMKLVSVTTSQGQWTNQNDLVIAQLGDLPAGGTVNATVAVIPQTPGRLISIFRVASSADDPDLNNNTAVEDTDVRVPIGISIADATAIEGNVGTTNVAFTVRLSPATGRTATVDFQTTGGTATAGVDYVPKSGTVVFPPGVNLTNITIQVIGDLLAETNETFSVVLSNPVEALLAAGRARAVGTILDDDEPCLTVSDLVIIEPDIGGTTEARVLVSLSQPSDRAVTVKYLTANATAVAGLDYISKAGTLTFLPGVTNLAVAITISGDSRQEANESFHVLLTDSLNARLCREQAVVTIHEEPTPSVSIADVRIVEGDTGTSSAVFQVTLSTPTSKSVEADFATANGPALAGSDYVAQSGRLAFIPGTTQREVSVLVYGDTVAEPDETFFVNLTNLVNARPLRAQAVGTIANDDPPVIVADTATLIAENCLPGNGAIDPFETVTVNFALNNAGYSPTTNLIATLQSSDGVMPLGGPQNYGALLPNGSSVARPFTFAVDRECGSAFEAILELRDGARVLPPVSFEFRVGRNTDGKFICCQSADVAVTLSDQPDPVIEKHTLTYTVTVTNRGPSRASEVVLTNRLHDGLQFVAATKTDTNSPGVLTTVGNLVIYRLDTLLPANFAQIKIEARPQLLGFLTSFSIVSARESDPDLSNNIVAAATEVIPETGLSIIGASVIEGGTTNVTVRLYPPRGQTVSVTVATADGTAAAATGDYLPLSGVRVTFPPGTTAVTMPITTLDDTLDEPDEFLYAQLSDPAGAPIGVGEAKVTIQDNDAPCLSIDDVDVDVGLFGQAEAVLTVSLSSASTNTIAFNYATADGSLGLLTHGAPAAAGTDYVPKAGMIVIPPGVTGTNLSLIVSGNTNDEGVEHFFVNLSGAVNATICDSQGIVRITDESPGAIQNSNASVIEGNKGTTEAVFTLRLTQAQRYAASVEFFTTDGTAMAGSDYLPASGTVAFPPGVLQTNISVRVLGDWMWEADEHFFLNLRNPRNASLAANQAVGTILNDDPIPAISAFDATEQEGDIGPTNAVFAISLSHPSSESITVTAATADETGQAGIDYLSALGLVTFDPGQTNRAFAVSVRGDTLDEPDETFFLRLSNLTTTNATFVRSEARGMILDDDPPPALVITDATVLEGDSGTTNATFVVSLAVASAKPISIDYTTSDGTATAGSDYTSTHGALSFLPGKTNAAISVVVSGDKMVEEDETFFVHLTNAVNVKLARARATGIIQNDDVLPALSIDDVALLEGDAGITNAVFTLTLSRTSAQPVTADFATADDTATADEDYHIGPATITILPGQTSATVAVPVIGDTLLELDERFFANLTNVTNAILARSQGVGTILNDDDDLKLPSLAINGVTVVEGDSSTNAVLTVTLSTANTQPVIVNFSTTDGSATSNSDYLPRFGSLTIPPGQTTTNITILVFGDKEFESDEDFFVRLDNPVNATVAVDQGRCLIVNDDRLPPDLSGQILIIQNRPDAEISQMEVYLQEDGYSYKVLDQMGLTLETILRFEAIIWADTSQTGVTANTIDLLRRAFAAGRQLYFVGENLLGEFDRLSAPDAKKWEDLIHLVPSNSAFVPPGIDFLEIDYSGEQRFFGTRGVVYDGRFGTVPDFAYPDPIDCGVSTGIFGETVLGRNIDGCGALLSFQDPIHRNRLVTQAFRTLPSVNDGQQEQRRLLFRNVVWWLLNARDCPTVDFYFSSGGSTAQPTLSQVGDEVTYNLEIIRERECAGRWVVVSNAFSGSVQFVNAVNPYGTVEQITNGGVLFQFPRADWTTANVSLTVRPLSPGSLTNQVSIWAGAESNTNNNQHTFVTQVEGQAPVPILGILQMPRGELELSILNWSPNVVYVLEQTSALQQPWEWQPYGDFPNGFEPVRISAPKAQSFFRVRIK